MGQMNLRGIDDELIKLVKATAASEGQTLTEFVCGVLRRDVRRGGWTPGASEGGKVERVSETVKKVATIPAVSSRPRHTAGCKCLMCKPPKN